LIKKSQISILSKKVRMKCLIALAKPVKNPKINYNSLQNS